MRKIFGITIFSTMLLVMLFSVVIPVFAQPSETTEKCKTGYEEDPSGVCMPSETGLSETPLAEIIESFLLWLLGVFGLIAIIGFVISGIQYITSAGDDNTVETAKRNMKWSLVGVVVALSGFIVIKAVDAMLNAQEFF